VDQDRDDLPNIDCINSIINPGTEPISINNTNSHIVQQYPVDIINPFDENITVSLYLNNTPDGWDASLSQDVIVLGGDESTTIIMTVIIPIDTSIIETTIWVMGTVEGYEYLFMWGVNVTVPHPPLAIISGPSQLLTFENGTFNGNDSYDFDGEIVEYIWDLGDGHYQSGASVTHSYEDDGLYPISLTVTDDVGLTATASYMLEVVNRPPVAIFEISRLVTLQLLVEGRKNNTVTMAILENGNELGNASVTRLPGCPEESANHTSFEIHAGMEYILNLRYEASHLGANPCNVSVDGVGDSIEVTFNAQDSMVQELNFSLGEMLTAVMENNTSFYFDATESYDPDGTVASYMWDFGENGSASGPIVQYNFTQGWYNITLTVADNDGATSYLTRQIDHSWWNYTTSSTVNETFTEDNTTSENTTIYASSDDNYPLSALPPQITVGTDLVPTISFDHALSDGELAIVTVGIENIGTVDSEGFVVRLFDGNNQLGSDFIVDKLGIFDVKNAVFTFPAIPKEYQLVAELDVLDTILESNEENNRAQAVMRVNGTIYGNTIRYNGIGVRGRGYIGGITANVIEWNDDGIVLDNAFGGVYWNEIFTNTGAGIGAFNGTATSIGWNTISGNGWAAVAINDSAPFVHENVIGYSPYGLYIENDKIVEKTINRTVDGNSTEEIIVTPNGTNIEFYLPAKAWISDIDMEISPSMYSGGKTMGYRTRGLTINETQTVALNATINGVIPDQWASKESWLMTNSTQVDGTEVNASDLGLTIEHDGQSYSLDDTGVYPFPVIHIEENTPPFIYNVMTENYNATGSFGLAISCERGGNTTWSPTPYGYENSISLAAPSVDVFNPQLEFDLPLSGCKDIFVTVQENGKNLSDNTTIDSGVASVDLEPLVGDNWSSMESYTIDIAIIYAVTNLTIDIGADGIPDWEHNGELTETIFASSATLVNALQYQLNEMEDTIAPFEFRTEYTGKVALSNIFITYSIVPTIYLNGITNTTWGIYVNSTNDALITNNIIKNNTHGIFIKDSTAKMKYITTLADGSTENVANIDGEFNSIGMVRLPPEAIVVDASLELAIQSSLPSPGNYSLTNKGTISNQYDGSLNASLNITPPQNWTIEYLHVVINNLKVDGEDANASYTNLTVSHQGVIKSPSFVGEGEYATAYAPSQLNATNLTFGINADVANTSADITLETHILNASTVQWEPTVDGVDTTLDLTHPEISLFNPRIELQTPSDNFANVTSLLLDNGESLQWNTDKKQAGTIELDLATISAIGDEWGPASPNISIGANLKYDLSRLSFDIGSDGEFEWEMSGEMPTDVTIAGASLIDGINKLNFDQGGNIPITLQAEGTGLVTLSNINISYTTTSLIKENQLINNTYGIHLKNSTANIEGNTLSGNDVGIYLNQSGGKIERNTIQSSGYGIYSTNGSEPTINGNTIQGDNATGIAADNSLAIIVENIIAIPNGTGILYQNSPDGLFIAENTITNCANGIMMDNVDGLDIGDSKVLDSNTLKGNTVGLFVRETSVDQEYPISDNWLEGNKVGIQFTGSSAHGHSEWSIDNNTIIDSETALWLNKSLVNISESVVRGNYSLHLANVSIAWLKNTDIGGMIVMSDTIGGARAQRTVLVQILDENAAPIQGATVVVEELGSEIINETSGVDGYVSIFNANIWEYSQNRWWTSYTPQTLKVSNQTLSIEKQIRLDNGTGIHYLTVYLTPDNDDDGLTDGEEKYIYSTNSSSNDTDGDGLWDGQEVGLIAPTCSDTAPLVFRPDINPNTTTSPLLYDTDGDGLGDGEEDSNQNGDVDSNETDPADPDTDDDYIWDGNEHQRAMDTDGDGLINALDPDSDDDGLLDGTEDANLNGVVDYWELDPLLNDTDGDGVNDGDISTLFEVGLLNVIGPGNYTIEANDVAHGVYDSTMSLDETLAVVIPGARVKILMKENETTVGRFMVTANTTGDFYLDYNNYSLHLRMVEFPWNLTQDDTDNDGVNDLREVIYFSRYMPNATFDDFDGDGLPAYLDNDTDEDGLLDGYEMRLADGGTIVDLNLYGGNDGWYSMEGEHYSVKLHENTGMPHLRFNAGGEQLLYNLTQVNSGGQTIGMTGNVTAVVNGTHIEYPDVFENISVTHDATLFGVKETFVIKERLNITENLRFISRFHHETGNLSVWSEGEEITAPHMTSSAVNFKNPDGDIVYSLPAPKAIDANGSSATCSYLILTSSEVTQVQVHVPVSFLNDNATVYPVAVDPTIEPGFINGSTTWTKDNGPYILQGNVGVADGNWLWVDPGVKIRFDGDYMFEVYGALYMDGTEAEPITVTTNNENPEAGAWHGFYFKAPEEVLWSHVDLSYATEALEFRSMDIDVTIDNSTFRDIARYNIDNYPVEGVGITLKTFDYNGNITIEHCTFENISIQPGAIRWQCLYVETAEGYPNIKIRNNTFNNVITGMELTGNVHIVGNHINDFSEYAIRNNGGISGTIANNQITGRGGGIQAANCLITNNRISLCNNGIVGNANYILDNEIFNNQIGISTGSGFFQIDNNEIYDNEYGVKITVFSPDENHSGHQNNIENNSLYGVYFGDEPNYHNWTVDFSDNWWGAPDGPSGVANGSGDAVSYNVIIDPYRVSKVIDPVDLYEPTEITIDSISLHWSEYEEEEFRRYEIHMSQTPNFIPTNETRVRTLYSKFMTTHTIEYLQEGTTYYFRIYVHGTTGSAYSNEVHATTYIPGPPVAIVGPDKQVWTNSVVTLNGSGSYDPYGLSLSYRWNVLFRPPGSSVSSTYQSTWSFTATVPGLYVFQLIVSNRFGIKSAPAGVLVYVRDKRTGPLDWDMDDDGLSDGDEIFGRNGYFTDPNNPDTDGDGLWDGNDVTIDEATYLGELTGQNGHYPTDPTKADTDGDNLWDGYDIGTYWGEMSSHRGFGPTDPNLYDTDGDGYGDMKELTNMRYKRQAIYTDPTDIDTDGDGLADNLELGGWEVYRITRSGDSSTWEVDSDPTKIHTFDTNLDDYEKYANILDPWTMDSDSDRISDYIELDNYDGERYNPNTADVLGPEIEVTARIVSKARGEYNNDYYVKVNIFAKDKAGLSLFQSKKTDATIWTYTLADGETALLVEHEHLIGRVWWDAIASGDVKVKVRDKNHNIANVTAHYEGALEHIRNVLAEIIKDAAARVMEGLEEIGVSGWVSTFVTSRIMSFIGSDEMLGGILKNVNIQISNYNSNSEINIHPIVSNLVKMLVTLRIIFLAIFAMWNVFKMVVGVNVIAQPVLSTIGATVIATFVGVAIDKIWDGTAQTFLNYLGSEAGKLFSVLFAGVTLLYSFYEIYKHINLQWNNYKIPKIQWLKDVAALTLAFFSGVVSYWIMIVSEPGAGASIPGFVVLFFIALLLSTYGFYLGFPSRDPIVVTISAASFIFQIATFSAYATAAHRAVTS